MGSGGSGGAGPAGAVRGKGRERDRGESDPGISRQTPRYAPGTHRDIAIDTAIHAGTPGYRVRETRRERESGGSDPGISGCRDRHRDTHRDVGIAGTGESCGAEHRDVGISRHGGARARGWRGASGARGGAWKGAGIAITPRAGRGLGRGGVRGGAWAGSGHCHRAAWGGRGLEGGVACTVIGTKRRGMSVGVAKGGAWPRRCHGDGRRAGFPWGWAGPEEGAWSLSWCCGRG